MRSWSTRKLVREEMFNVFKQIGPPLNSHAAQRIARDEVARAMAATERRTATNVCREATRAAVAETERLVMTTVRREAAHAVTAEVEAKAESVVSNRLESAMAMVRQVAAAEAMNVVTSSMPKLVTVSVNGSAPAGVTGDTHVVLPELFLAVGSGCHVFLVGPAGTGKSTMARQAAEALGLGFYALSVGPTTPTSKLFGYLDAGGSYHRTPLREAYENGGLMLMDELDNGHPGLLTELNQALALEICAFPDGMITSHPDFRLVATGNTYGMGGDRRYVGRQQLDAATLDRLVVIDVPVDEGLESRLALAHAPSRREHIEHVLAEVRRLRRTAETKRLPVIFSPRAGIHAARLLEAGASVDTAMRLSVTKGLSEAHRSALGLC